MDTGRFSIKTIREGEESGKNLLGIIRFKKVLFHFLKADCGVFLTTSVYYFFLI